VRFDAFTAERIGAAWLSRWLAPLTDFGRRADDVAVPFAPGDEVAAAQHCARIVELAERLSPDGVARLRAALRTTPDPHAVLSRARVGDPLGDVDLYDVARFATALEATAQAWDRAGGERVQRPPTVPQIIALLAPGRTADGSGFYLADEFAPELAHARRAARDAQAGVENDRARRAAQLADVLGFVPEGDEFIVMRDALAGTLPAGVRVVRETATYRLCALEPDTHALRAQAAGDDAQRLVALEEERVRARLAEQIARAGEAVESAAHALGELDRTLARIAFTQRFGGCVPEFSRERFAFVDAAFAPLREALADEGRDYTPLTLDMQDVAVLTGPNMGGKSAALATCGFLALCVANGVPPPATRITMPLFARMAWIGGGDADRARLLSAFATEVVRVRDVLAQTATPELFLVDEFARTTGPREGRALLVGLVEALRRRHALALVATHFNGVAAEAGTRHLAIAGAAAETLAAIAAADDIHAALDALGASMDYRIVAVEAARTHGSDAIALARVLGIDKQIIARAQSLFTG
jgi:DNA mismatch repair protein MutS2